MGQLFVDYARIQSIASYDQRGFANNAEVAALKTVTSFLVDDDRIRCADLDLDAGDVVSRGLRATVIAARNRTLVAALLEKLTSNTRQ